MEALLLSPTSRLVARPVEVVLSHVYAPALILNPSLAARIALVITKRRESATLSHVQVSCLVRDSNGCFLKGQEATKLRNEFNWRKPRSN